MLLSNGRYVIKLIITSELTLNIWLEGIDLITVCIIRLTCLMKQST